MKKEVLPRLLQAISKFVSRMNAKEIEEFITFLERGAMPSKHKVQRGSILPIEKTKVDEILLKLSKANDRGEGLEVLEGEKLSRSNLELLASECNVHITKQDKVSRIEQKLVESLVGARLSSRAIRGD